MVDFALWFRKSIQSKYFKAYYNLLEFVFWAVVCVLFQMFHFIRMACMFVYLQLDQIKHTL